MGRTICSAVAADPDLVFVAAVDPGGAGETIEGVGGRRTSPCLRRRTMRRRRRLHRRPCRPHDAPVARHARHACGGRDHRIQRRGSRPVRLDVRCHRWPELCDRAELRHLRGADDAFRRDGCAVVRHRRDHRTAPRPQDRRAVGHRREDRRTDGRRSCRRLRSRPDRDRGLPGSPRWSSRLPASAPTRCGCAAWSRTKR